MSKSDMDDTGFGDESWEPDESEAASDTSDSSDLDDDFEKPPPPQFDHSSKKPPTKRTKVSTSSSSTSVSMSIVKPKKKTQRQTFNWTESHELKLLTFYLSQRKNNTWVGVEEAVGVDKVRCQNKIALLTKSQPQHRKEIFLRKRLSELEQKKKNGTLAGPASTSWSTTENIKLAQNVLKFSTKWTHIASLMIARNKKMVSQQWKQLTKRFNTEIPAQVLLHLQQSQTTTTKSQNEEWTDEEDVLIRHHVRIQGTNNWNVISSLMKTRSAADCEAKYNIIESEYSHHKVWTEKEISSLESLYEKYKGQNYMWARISYEIKTKSATACAGRFRLREKSYKFTQNQKDELLNLVMKFKNEGNPVDWSGIINVELFQDKTVYHLKTEWYNNLNPEIVKGDWSKEEDRKLKSIKVLHPDWDYNQISEEMKNRCPAACRMRWNNYLREGVNNKPLTEEESEKLQQAIESGHYSIHSIQKDLFPSRTCQFIANAVSKLKRSSIQSEIQKFSFKTIGSLVKNAICEIDAEDGSSIVEIVEFVTNNYPDMDIPSFEKQIEKYIKRALKPSSKYGLVKTVVGGVSKYSVKYIPLLSNRRSKTSRWKVKVKEEVYNDLTAAIKFCTAKIKEYSKVNESRMGLRSCGPVHEILDNGFAWDGEKIIMRPIEETDTVSFVHTCRYLYRPTPSIRISDDMCKVPDNPLVSVIQNEPVEVEGILNQEEEGVMDEDIAEQEDWEEIQIEKLTISWTVGWSSLINCHVAMRKSLYASRLGGGCAHQMLAYIWRMWKLRLDTLQEFFYCVNNPQHQQLKDDKKQKRKEQRMKEIEIEELNESGELSPRQIKRRERKERKKIERESGVDSSSQDKTVKKPQSHPNIAELVKFIVRFSCKEVNCMRKCFPRIDLFSPQSILYIFEKMVKNGMTLTEDAVNIRANNCYQK